LADAGLTRARRNIAWIEQYCAVPEGRDVGKPVKLRAWQRKEIERIYGSPTRRAIISFGRKNGKSALASFLLLLHLCGPEAKANSQLYSAAQSREQASVLFNLAAKCVRMSPDLNSVIIIRDTAKELVCAEIGTKYRALSADASTAYGLSPVFTVHDELGQVKGPRSELYEALETASGAHEEPLTVIISTQAPTDGDLLSILIDDAKKGGDKRVKVSVYEAATDIDPFTEEAIRQANPAFGDFQNAKETLAMAEDARRMPSREPEFRNLILNQRVEMNSPFIPRSVWDRCGGRLHDWGQEPVWSGLDLSATSDLTAHVPICWIEDAWEVRPTFWLPGDGLREKSRSDRIDYDLWHKMGFLETTPGRAVEYEFVAEQLYEFERTHNWRGCAFDRWAFKHLRPWLLKAGFTEERVDALFVEFGQGFQSMSPALRDTEAALLAGKVRHGQFELHGETKAGQPVLNMCAANAVVTTDPAGGRKLNKQKSATRIDGMVALAMAFGIAPNEVEPAATYEMLIV
jgi:phage terminase large subunit-like protein